MLAADARFSTGSLIFGPPGHIVMMFMPGGAGQ